MREGWKAVTPVSKSPKFLENCENKDNEQQTIAFTQPLKEKEFSATPMNKYNRKREKEK